MSFLLISRELTIYLGGSLFVIGIIGNGTNIIIFTTERTYRTTPCTFYFLICSINNVILLIFSLLIRILSVGFSLDIVRTTSIWCQIRQYSTVVFNVISLTCSCLAAIDQFFVTSRSHSLRNFSQIKTAYRLVFITTLIWLLHGIPIFLFYNISSITATCTAINSVYSIYASIYLLSFLFIIPLLIMIVFGWLTYRNMHRITVLTLNKIDRQLVRMTFIQILLVIISFLPYGTFSAYSLFTTHIIKDSNQRTIENFTSTVVGLIVNIFNTVCFFLSTMLIIYKKNIRFYI